MKVTKEPHSFASAPAETDAFIQKLLRLSAEKGISAAEVFLSSRESFRAMCQQGAISGYTVNSTRGLSLRGLYNGRMGYASGEAFDDDAAEQLVSGVIESASLTEDKSVQEIYPGAAGYPTVDHYAPDLDRVAPGEKLDFILNAEKELLSGDPRVCSAVSDSISTVSSQVRIVNSYGLDLKKRDNLCFAFLNALAKDGQKSATGYALRAGRAFDPAESAKMAAEAREKALFMLDAQPVPTGTYRAIFDPNAMSDLLGAFSGIFSAENAQQNMSLLAGKEGEKIASDAVTLVDDPLLEGGFGSQAFDDEGVPCRTKEVISGGVLTTLLHNLKTARKAGCDSTGNASKASYGAPVRVAPSNFYFKPGSDGPDALMAAMGEGLVITEVSGLHAGANALSGDFSLIAEGYTVRGGKKDRPVEQITVAGNFYSLLRSIRAVGSDLTFLGSSIGSPSVDVGEIRVAGK